MCCRRARAHDMENDFSRVSFSGVRHTADRNWNFKFERKMLERIVCDVNSKRQFTRQSRVVSSGARAADFPILFFSLFACARELNNSARRATIPLPTSRHNAINGVQLRRKKKNRESDCVLCFWRRPTADQPAAKVILHFFCSIQIHIFFTSLWFLLPFFFVWFEFIETRDHLITYLCEMKTVFFFLWSSMKRTIQNLNLIFVFLSFDDKWYSVVSYVKTESLPGLSIFKIEL